LRFLGTTLLISYFTSPQIPLPAHKLLPIHAELFRVVKFDKINIQRGLLVFKKDLQGLRIGISKENVCGRLFRKLLLDSILSVTFAEGRCPSRRETWHTHVDILFMGFATMIHQFV